MKSDNITKWAHDLRTTVERQATGALAMRLDVGEVKDSVGYCCIGFGCTVSAPGIAIRWPDESEDFIDDGDPTRARFGTHAVDDLAPIEFMEWLGYDADHWNMDRESAYDIHPDWPTNLRERSAQDVAAKDDGGSNRYDHQGKHLVSVSLAGLNDDGVTFAQIADVIHHFGLSDDPTGNIFDNTGEIQPV